jgi:ABC-type cobalamin/Fe3+-siderophores transport system ATPase subunit
MTEAQIKAIATLKLANNGVTLRQSLKRDERVAVLELVAMGIAKETTMAMHGFGLMPAFKLA